MRKESRGIQFPVKFAPYLGLFRNGFQSGKKIIGHFDLLQRLQKNKTVIKRLLQKVSSFG